MIRNAKETLDLDIGRGTSCPCQWQPLTCNLSLSLFDLTNADGKSLSP